MSAFFSVSLSSKMAKAEDQNSALTYFLRFEVAMG